jgi:hypothetical protein
MKEGKQNQEAKLLYLKNGRRSKFTFVTILLSLGAEVGPLRSDAGVAR